jgi:serine/threonine-protein kinase RsbW
MEPSFPALMSVKAWRREKMDDPMECKEFDADKLVMKLGMTIPADVLAISPVVEQIMSQVREMSCAEGKEFEIETSLREALANAIVHGCQQDCSKEVEVCIACDESRGILIVVRDPGPGFDPRTIPSPVKGQNVYSSHGRGIFLISQLMDEVVYERGGTEIHMRKH